MSALLIFITQQLALFVPFISNVYEYAVGITIQLLTGKIFELSVIVPGAQPLL